MYLNKSTQRLQVTAYFNHAMQGRQVAVYFNKNTKSLQVTAYFNHSMQWRQAAVYFKAAITVPIQATHVLIHRYAKA